MCSPVSRHALTFLRAHYRALLQYAYHASIVAVLVTLSPLSLSPIEAQAAPSIVNSILTGKSDDTQSWGDYLSTNLATWEQQWRAAGYTVATNVQNKPWGNSNPDINNTWGKGIKMPGGIAGNSVYYIDYIDFLQKPSVTWNNVIFSESQSTFGFAQLILNEQSNLSIADTLFYKNKTTNQSGQRTDSTSIIYTRNLNITIQDSAFIGNEVDKRGNPGVIESDKAITIKAVNSDVIFAENTFTYTSDEAPAISKGTALNLQAATGRSIVFDDPIVSGIGLSVNSEDGNEGTVVLGSGLSTAMSLGAVSVVRGTLEVEKSSTNGIGHSISSLSLDQPATLALQDEVVLTVGTLNHSGNVELQHGSTLNINNAWTPAAGAQIKVTGNTTVKATTVSFPNAVTISFHETKSRDTSKAMLTLEQTATTTRAQPAIALDHVTIAADVDIDQALQSNDGVILMASTAGFTGKPKFQNNLFELNYDASTGRFKVTAISTDPTDPGDTGQPSNPETPVQPGDNPSPSEPETPLTPEEQQQAAIENFTTRLGKLGANSAQQQVFKGMMRAYGNAESSPYYDDFASVWSYLQLAPVPEMLNALTVLTPDNSALVLTHERALNEEVADAIFNQPDAQPLSEHTTLWLKASTVSAKDEGSNAFELDRNSVALGFTTKLTSSWDVRAGFALSDFDGTVSSRNFKGDAYRIFAGTNYQMPVGPGILELGGLVQAGQSSYEESSSHPALGHFATDYDVITLGAALRAGYTIATQLGAITPELALSYLHADSDSLQAPLGQAVSSATADLVTAQAGFNFKAQLLTTANAQLTLNGALHLAYDLTSEGLERTVTLADGTSYQLDGMEPDDFRLLPQLSLELSLYDSLKLEAGFRRSQGDDYRENLWQVNAQYRF